jgi:hypothetical protein
VVIPAIPPPTTTMFSGPCDIVVMVFRKPDMVNRL